VNQSTSRIDEPSSRAAQLRQAGDWRVWIRGNWEEVFDRIAADLRKMMPSTSR
jgi:hypothetical protein